MSSSPPGRDKEDSVTYEAAYNPRKRARKGTSCLQCRRRKLRCDSIRPVCSRCVKSGDPDVCEYNLDGFGSNNEDEVLPDARVYQPPRQPHPMPPAVRQEASHKPDAAPSRELQEALGTIRLQRGNIAQLEQQISRLTDAVLELSLQRTPGHPRPGPLMTNDTTNRIAEDPKTIERNATFRGKCFKSSFWGFTYPLSLTAEFPLLNSYSQGFLGRHAMLIRAVNDIQLLDKRRKGQARKWKTSTEMETETLCHLLPTKDVLDPLIRMYLETLEHVYHILHIPSFWKDYQALWTHPLSEAIPSFVTTVLLMASSTLCVQEPKEISFIGENSTNRELAEKWVTACEQWQQKQSQKWLTLAYFQNRCLLIITRFMNGIKIKRWYSETGALVHFAISTGLHIEPQNSETPGKISVFDSEMRRRLWAVIVQLDIEACLHRGMPSMIDTFYHDSPPPINVDDGEMVEAMEVMPPARPLEDFTPMSCLIQYGLSRDLRLKLLRLLNTPEAYLPPSKFLNMESKILQILTELQQLGRNGNSQQSASIEFARAYISLQLHQLLLNLYRKVIRVDRETTILNYAKAGCYSTAADIVTAHERLSSDNSFIIVCLRGDIVQAALSLCFDLSTWDISTVSPTLPTFRNPDPATLFAHIESALHLLSHRVIRIGGIYRRYWVLAVAFAAVKARLFPAHAEEYDRATADKISSIVYKMLSLQEDRVRERSDALRQDQEVQPCLYGNSQGQGSDVPALSVLEYGLSTPLTDLANVDFANVADWNWDDILRM